MKISFLFITTEMAFKHTCKHCPMKFISETGLQLHLPVHSDSATNCRFEAELQEFFQSFFPSLDPSGIPSLSPNSIPSPPDEFEHPISEEVQTYTTLLNMKVPGYDPIRDSLHLEDLPPISVKKPGATIKFVRPLRYASPAVIRPVSVAPSELTRPDIFRPTVLSRIVPTIQRLRRLGPIGKQIEFAFKTPAEVKSDTTSTQRLPKKSFRKRGDRSMVGIKPYHCEGCSKRFATLKSLLSHKNTAHGKKQYSCFICHERFALSHKLSQHLLQHTKGTNQKRGRGGRVLYACDVCQRSFAKINYLTLHKKCHENRGDEAQELLG